MFKVEKGIEVPRSASHTGTRYPWMEMGEGDSFLVEATEEVKHKASARVQVAGYAWLKRNPDTHGHLRVSTRMVEGGIRVWFVAK